MIDETVLKEILEKELEKYTNNAIFDDETEYFPKEMHLEKDLERHAVMQINFIIQNMTKEEFKSRIEDLVEKYFEDNDEGISESYTILYPNGTSIGLNYDFGKNQKWIFSRHSYWYWLYC